MKIKPKRILQAVMTATLVTAWVYGAAYFAALVWLYAMTWAVWNVLDWFLEDDKDDKRDEI